MNQLEEFVISIIYPLSYVNQATGLTIFLEIYVDEQSILLTFSSLYLQLESIRENAVTLTLDSRLQGSDDDVMTASNFIPSIRHGVWAHIGSRKYMEDTHVCIENIGKRFGSPALEECSVSFYGVRLYFLLLLSKNLSFS